MPIQSRDALEDGIKGPFRVREVAPENAVGDCGIGSCAFVVVVREAADIAHKRAVVERRHGCDVERELVVDEKAAGDLAEALVGRPVEPSQRRRHRRRVVGDDAAVENHLAMEEHCVG